MIAELLKPTAHRPISNTHHDCSAQGDNRPLSTKRNSQGHPDESHYDHAEWARIFSLKRH